jgi:hypothetical protein
MWFFRTHDSKLDEKAREERGKLAAAIVKNDRTRHRLNERVREDPVSDMLSDIFSRLDEGSRD